jgi:hypothetical protein
VTVLDDYDGRPIRFTEERLEHILSHPEMALLRDRIIETVKSPEFVVESRSDPAVHLFYRRQITSAFGDKFLCVVVKYGPGDAFIITAYLTDKVKPGTLLWPKP